MLKRTLTQAQEDLIIARRMIADKANWCQFYSERDGRHCAIGALNAILASYPVDERQARFKSAIMLLAGTETESSSVAKVMLSNDETAHGHEIIMGMFDKAIAG